MRRLLRALPFADANRVCWGAQEVDMSMSRFDEKSSRRSFAGIAVSGGLALPAIAPLGRCAVPEPAAGSATAAARPDRPEAGGPSGDNGPIALPKKPENPDTTPPPAPAAAEVQEPRGRAAT